MDAAGTTADAERIHRSGPRLASLAPKYEEKHHGLYLDLLDDALGRDEARNIALTGAYGTGKSSILRELTDRHREDVVSISLSSLGAPDDIPAADDANPAAGTPTNQIQKEIVKQILYQVSPHKVPRSRFRRATRDRKRDGVLPAVIVGLVAGALLVLGDPVKRVIAEGFLPAAAVFVAIFLTVGGIAYWLVRAAHGRLVIDRIGAGPTSITLSPQSTSFFDQYLDEIVYFFEVTKRSLVVIEDIDRFDDSQIFETLRSLNTLLNEARQLEQRPIRFIYAMRDSVFEQLGVELTDESSGFGTAADQTTSASSGPAKFDENYPRDIARENVERANRTKFFDLVIPVVPFITRQNARDLMSEMFEAADYQVDRQLVSIVARHIADMRLVTNIWNEFTVFHRQLIEGEHPVPGLTDDRLLAIVVYKNVHLADFEKIRLGTSKLDDLYRFGRNLSATTAEKLESRANELRAAIDGQDTIQFRSDRLTTKLLVVARALAGNQATIQFLREGRWSANLAANLTSDHWREISDGAMVMINGAQQYQFSSHQIAGLIGEVLGAAGLGLEKGSNLELELEQAEARISDVRHANWRDLYHLQEPAPPGAGGNQAPFAEQAKRLTRSPLACDLIAHGYLNEYFSIYVSPFYGEHISANAMNYVLRQIDRGIPDTDYQLARGDVYAILTERPGALRDPSMYNISVVDHLLEYERAEGRSIVEEMLKLGLDEMAFINAYVRRGSRPRDFVKVLAPSWDGIFYFLAENAAIGDSKRQALFDAALGAWNPDGHYLLGHTVTLYVEENYREFATLTKSAMDAGRAAKLVVRAQARLDDVAVLTVRALMVIRDGGAYSMTRGNLTHLTGVADPTLDLIKGRDKTVYADTLKRLDEYLKLDRPRYTISKRGNLYEIINDVAEQQTGFVETVIAHSHPDCTVQDISSVGEEAWAALASGRRFPPTIENLATYVRKRSVDDHLATLLGTSDRISEPGTQPQARQVAIAVLGASDVIRDPAQRVGLVRSIALDPPLARSEIAAEEGELTGLLLEAGVIPDDETTFTADVLADPATLEAAIARSKAYPTFMAPKFLPAAAIPTVISSMRVPRTVKQAILDGLAGYTTGGRPDVFQAIAEHSVDNGLALTADPIDALMKGGAQRRTMVALIARSELSPAEVQRAVHQLGGDYALISWYGTSKPVVDADEDHLNILSRLQKAGVVSSYTEEPDGKHVRVHLHHREPGT